MAIRGERVSLRERRVRRAGPAAARTDEEITLVETLDRVLSRGVVAQAEVVLTVAEIPLVYVGLQALVSSVETAATLAEEAAGVRTPGPGARGVRTGAGGSA